MRPLSSTSRSSESTQVGSICADAIAAKIEDVCIDIAIDGGHAREGWDKCDAKEMKWRGWSPNGFARRRNAVHVEATVTFRDGPDGLEFDMVSAAEIDLRTGKRKPIFAGLPAGNAA